MIRICFYNYGGGELHVSRKLEINREVDEYLIRHIPGLQLEATDSEADMMITVFIILAVRMKRRPAAWQRNS